MISRNLSQRIQSSKKSALILGPRQTGKSTLVKNLTPDLTVDLADQEVFLANSQDFSLLRSQIERTDAKTVFIDEIQRIPEMLNTVQSLIDQKKGLKFYLTGSSARKLKRGGANLLPGRVINYSLGPLHLSEVDYLLRPEDFVFGFLPGVYTESDRVEKKGVLTSYSANYVNEEIKAEALVRDLPSFSRFLHLTPELVGNFVDYSKIAKLSKISRHQVPRYFEILEDTMIGYRVLPEERLVKKYDLIKHPKFFIFDVGVFGGLLKTYEYSSDRSGKLTEQLVFQQLIHSATAHEQDIQVHTLRTRGGAEIDFWCRLNGKHFGIEVKSSDRIIEDDVKHLVHFKKLEPKANFFLFHSGKGELKKSGIWCLPIGAGFKELGL